jgi:hypothetical protein
MSSIYADSPGDEIVTSIRVRAFVPWAMLFVIGAAFFVAVYGTTPPRTAGVATPVSEFSSARALRHVESIARQPRPMGSSAHTEARNYLLTQLTALGLDPQVQQTTVINPRTHNLINAATVANIVARMKGTSTPKALLLSAHYDSVATSAGASDDAAGVATLLETARALKTQAPLQHDVIFLFTDGEEPGLLGARAFVNEHPWAKDVGLVMNFEARGNKGPSIMFETSSGNQQLIESFGNAAPYPVASSLTYEIYRLLPNDTDLSVFKAANIPGLNFAYLNGFTHYHTSLDTPAAMDERSLQHHGASALALTRHFGNKNFDSEQGSDAVYFDLLGLFLVRYPSSLAMPLTVFALLLFGFVVFLGFGRGHLSVKGVLLGISLVLVSFIVVPLSVFIAWWLVTSVQGARGITTEAIEYRSVWYLQGFVALSIAVNAALYVALRRRVSVQNVFIAGAFWWLLLAVLSGLFLTGASYLFIWPLVFSLAGMAFLFRQRSWRGDGPGTVLAMLAGALPLVLLWSPIIYLIFTALRFDALIAVAFMLALAMALLMLPLRAFVKSGEWLFPQAAAAAGVVLLVIAMFTSGFDSARRRSHHLFYAMNADTGKAVWASGDERPDEYTSQFLTGDVKREVLAEYIPWRRDTFLMSPAPVAGIASPEVVVLEDAKSDSARTVKLRVRSARQSQQMSIFVDTGASVSAAAVNGQNINAGRNSTSEARQPWRLDYHGVPPEGIELGFTLNTAGPIKLFVVDQSYGLPEITGSSYKGRPAYLMPTAWRSFSDQTLVNKAFTF